MLVIIFIILILILIINNQKKYEKYTNMYNINNLYCNHYKFKSDEEFINRIREFNKNDGYMKNKLDLNNNKKWNTDSNAIINKNILIYLDALKLHTNSFLKKVRTYSYDKNYKYNISIVVMFRYEDDYLDEWLHYYIMNGVDHFYMYSNYNTTKTIKILIPYILKGYITLIPWDNKNWCVSKNKRRTKWNNYSQISLQNCAFMDFNKKYKHETKWIIKVDVDEYIYYKTNFVLLKDILNNTDKKYFKIPRIDFGNNFHKKKQNGLILENYIRSKKKPDSIKSIILTSYINKNDRGEAHLFLLC
jgi:hypothetical protein